jgi:uncharacterized protein (UPF0303 family)
MDKDYYVTLDKVLLEQEKLLRFDHFTNRDAWELGTFFVDKVYKSDFDLAIAIRKLNGNILFQHTTGNTSLVNQKWMDRKFRTVTYMERSSLAAWAISAILNEPVPVHGLSESEYVFCGGGFPIRLKAGEIAAVLTVSGLRHDKDHSFMVESLSEWLKIDVPSIDSFFQS